MNITLLNMSKVLLLVERYHQKSQAVFFVLLLFKVSFKKVKLKSYNIAIYHIILKEKIYEMPQNIHVQI